MINQSDLLEAEPSQAKTAHRSGHTENVRDWWALFVNRKAYTRRSPNPRPETRRHYHYQPENKDSGQPMELDPPTGAQTPGRLDHHRPVRHQPSIATL